MLVFFWTKNYNIKNIWIILTFFFVWRQCRITKWRLTHLFIYIFLATFFFFTLNIPILCWLWLERWHLIVFGLSSFIFFVEFIFLPLSGKENLHYGPVSIPRLSVSTDAHSVLGNAVTTLWMTCCINQCLKIMILKLFKLKMEKKRFWLSAMGGLTLRIACCRIA